MIGAYCTKVELVVDAPTLKDIIHVCRTMLLDVRKCWNYDHTQWRDCILLKEYDSFHTFRNMSDPILCLVLVQKCVKPDAVHSVASKSRCTFQYLLINGKILLGTRAGRECR